MTVPAAATAIATAQATIATLGPLSPDSDSAVVRVALAAVATAQASLLVSRTATEADLSAISARAVPGSLVGSAADLTAALADTGALAALTQAQGYLGRAAVNLGGVPWV